jgi:VanZ family protein
MSVQEIVSIATQSVWTKLASGVSILLIVVLSLLPQDERVTVGLPGQGEHFIAYSVTGLLLGLSIPSKNGPLLAAAHLAWIAALLEFLQQWSPGRHPRVSDAVISAVAGAVGAALAAWLRKRAETDFRPPGN